MDQSVEIPLAPAQSSKARAFFKELRLHQWSKNALVVVPVVLSPGVPQLDLLTRALIAALCVSLCASAGYVLNDLLDLERRPRASHQAAASVRVRCAAGAARTRRCSSAYWR